LPAVAAPPAATLSAFERYAAVVEGRIRSDYSTTKFLRILPDESKWARVHKGEALVESAQALGLKPDIAIPDGQVQHWVAAAFLPNATLDAVLPRLRNYNNRSRYMKPEIIASRLKDHHGDVFEVYLRLVEKSIVSGVFDLDLQVVYRTERHGRLAINSRSTSVVEVSDALAPVGSAARDQGLLWALNHYWRILQMDDGLYVECEALVLSRQTPFMLGWIARPIIARAARESLIKTVHATILIMNSPDASASAESRSWDVQRVGDMDSVRSMSERQYAVNETFFPALQTESQSLAHVQCRIIVAQDLDRHAVQLFDSRNLDQAPRQLGPQTTLLILIHN